MSIRFIAVVELAIVTSMPRDICRLRRLSETRSIHLSGSHLLPIARPRTAVANPTMTRGVVLLALRGHSVSIARLACVLQGHPLSGKANTPSNQISHRRALTAEYSPSTAP